MALRDRWWRGAARRRRPQLLVLVFAVFLVLVGVTASGLVGITSSHLRSATLNASVDHDAKLVELWVNDHLAAGDLQPDGPSADRQDRLTSALATLTDPHQILLVEVRALDGRVLAASDSAIVGEHPLLSDAMRRATDGNAMAVLSASAEDAAGPPLPSAAVLREYLPITDASGTVQAVMVVWRDAVPLLASMGQAERDVLLLVVGAAVVLAAVLFLIFRAAHARILRQQHQLVEATRRDPVTGMLNHGAIVARLSQVLDERRAERGTVAIAMLDVDNFTGLNETQGHDAGDEVLQLVAAILEEQEGCEAGRFGPDEFVVIWSRGGVPQAETALAELRDRLSRLAVRFEHSEDLPVSVSAGIAAFPTHASAVTDLLSEATVALQEAKAGGGNSVRVAQLADERAAEGRFDVLQGLVIAVDTKDRYTRRHSEDVARYAVFLARRLGLDDEMVATIRRSGLLHDVGKIGIPDGLLRKPGKLTAEEFDIFKQHVALGDSIVRDVPNLALVRAGIRHHHERWDGRGYLDGLSGEEIPLVGRIMAVADAFSAMTTTRPYRKALPIEEALKRLGDAAGTQLQEELVQTFIAGMESDADAPLPGDTVATGLLHRARVA